MDEKLEKHIKDSLNHKINILNSCKIMVEYLLKNGQEQLAIDLTNRCLIHDNSKFSNEEINCFMNLKPNKETFVNPQKTLSEEEKKAIKLHWKNNKHHPEYYENVNDMEEVDILEMVCDWHSRSVEFGTDLIEFAKVRQENRFHFSKNVFEKILMYCYILNS